MEQVLNLSVADIIKNEKGCKSFNDEIVIVNLRGEGEQKSNIRHDIRIRFEALSVTLICDGELDININGSDYHFNSKALFDIIDLHVFQCKRISSDFRGYQLIMTKSFLEESMRGVKRMPLSDFLARFNYPIEELTDEETSLLESAIQRMIERTATNNHIYQRDLIKNELRNFLLEMMNIITHKSKIEQAKVLRNKEMMIGTFLHLLNIHCKKEHTVEFYAQELCIDPKYLSRILKSFNGKTATTWIDEAIMKEAVFLLNDPKIPIQQVSEMLFFSDQSAFGKFFKRHSGVSPLNYRREGIRK